MKRQDSSRFNKEKLVFIGASGLLALAVYHMLTSTPAMLVATESVSPLAPPGPLDKERVDTRVGNVLYYLANGNETNMRDVLTGQVVDRGRKNPFEPLDDFEKERPKPELARRTKPADIAPAPPPPEAPVQEAKKKEEPRFDAKDQVAQVDFSGVMTMKGMSYGLLKSKDDKTIQVKVGDYMEEFKYTVTKIEKQAIWVTDDDNHTFVARDMSMEDSGASSDEEKDAKPKKEKPKAEKKPIATPAAPAEKPKPAAQANNQGNNQGNNQNNRRGGGGGGGGRGGNGMGQGGNGMPGGNSWGNRGNQGY